MKYNSSSIRRTSLNLITISSLQHFYRLVAVSYFKMMLYRSVHIREYPCTFIHTFTPFPLKLKYLNIEIFFLYNRLFLISIVIVVLLQPTFSYFYRHCCIIIFFSRRSNNFLNTLHDLK